MIHLFGSARAWDLARRVRILSGEISESVRVREGPVLYSVRPWAGQKTGGFLDHPEILTIPETRYLKCAVLECL
jgi:23S rRNA G2069 N7-methylase RlmK/C1962 C5-methylase RlmI